jgi:UDPglucose 6-dehydrogenase
MRVSIIGTGYVGLVSGVCMAERGHDVICVDVDPSKIATINSGRPPIHEPGLPEALARNAGRRLTATADLAAAVAATDITFIAVGTPATDGRIDLKYVQRAAEEIGLALRTKNSYHVLVVKSTVIPGTTDGLVKETAERASGKKAGRDFGLGMNPEFLTEGRAIDDFMHPDRIVLGGIDERTQDVLAELYRDFPGAPLVRCNCRTAEMIKYASNSLLATLISFSNELGRLCSSLGDVDIVEVMRGVHLSSYLTSKAGDGSTVTAPISSFLEAGCGFGGSCLPKDVTALVAQGIDRGLQMPLLKSVLEINRTQPAQLLQLIAEKFPDLRGRKVAVLGIAFKPDTDDVRESPAFPIIAQLRAAGADVTAYDPVARPVGHPLLNGVRLADSLRSAVTGADVVVHVTRWREFEALPKLLAELGARPLVVDGRRNLRPDAFTSYAGIGLSPRSAA